MSSVKLKASMSKNLYLVILFIITSCHRAPSEEFTSHITQIDVPITEDYIVYVQKEDHTLTLYKQGQIIKQYNVNLRNELPARRLVNDGQTPEGIFEVYQMAVVTSPPWSRWIAFNTVDLAREIFINEINNGGSILEKYEAEFGPILTDDDIRRFNKINPDTEFLRGFGIHGGGYSPGNDWTLGCPALNDDDVIELYDLLLTNPNGGIGTKVIIVD